MREYKTGEIKAARAAFTIQLQLFPIIRERERICFANLIGASVNLLLNLLPTLLTQSIFGTGIASLLLIENLEGPVNLVQARPSLGAEESCEFKPIDKYSEIRI